MKRRTAADVMRPVYPPRDEPPRLDAPPPPDPPDPFWVRWFLGAVGWVASKVKSKENPS